MGEKKVFLNKDVLNAAHAQSLEMVAMQAKDLEQVEFSAHNNFNKPAGASGMFKSGSDGLCQAFRSYGRSVTGLVLHAGTTCVWVYFMVL